MSRISSWIINFPELEINKDKVFCKACAKIVVCEKKFKVVQHVKTSLHKAKLQKMKSQPVQQCVIRSFQNADKTKSDKEVFNQDLCKALVAANIPLKKLQNLHLREFLQKYCNQTIPDESTLRKKMYMLYIQM